MLIDFTLEHPRVYQVRKNSVINTDLLSNLLTDLKVILLWYNGTVIDGNIHNWMTLKEFLAGYQHN